MGDKLCGVPHARGTFLERVAARMQLRDRFNDAEVDEAVPHCAS
jgi:hypothetical protein